MCEIKVCYRSQSLLPEREVLLLLLLQNTFIAFYVNRQLIISLFYRSKVKHNQSFFRSLLLERPERQKWDMRKRIGLVRLNCIICIVLYALNCEVDVLLYCFGCYCYCRLSGGEFGLGTWPLRLQCINYISDTKCNAHKYISKHGYPHKKFIS